MSMTWMVMAGGLNSANYQSEPVELPARPERQTVEQWNGTEWVVRIVTFNPATGRYE